MIDAYLLVGLVSLLGLVFFLLIDIDIPIGAELEFSFKGVLLGISFSSFNLYYIQNYLSNNIILSILGVILFIIGYKLLMILMSLLRKGETGDVLSVKSLLFKVGTIEHMVEKENDFFYEIIIEDRKYIAKSDMKLDENEAIVVSKIEDDNTIKIVNIELNKKR